MDVNKYIDFSGKVIAELQGLSEVRKSYYTGMIDQVTKRRDNQHLNVALIGDFSSGKSTFINAFIRKDLLKTAWLATTAVPTHILYHKKDKIEMIVEGANQKKYRIHDIEERRLLEELLGIRLPADMKDVITALSTTNEFSHKIKLIELWISSFESLEKICIIDTPGVNPGASDTKEHVEVTRNVLREYADATIVLFQAQYVYTRSFQVFLEENARHFMDDAVFVITMLDLVDEEEREDIVGFVRRNLKETFHLKDPQVFGCSAKYAVEGNEGAEFSKRNQKWKQEFDVLRAEIIQYMNSRKENIINSQMQQLMGQLMEELDAEVRRSMSEIETQLEILERNSIKYLAAELRMNDRVYADRIEMMFDNLDFEKEYHQMFSNIIDNAVCGINSCKKIRGDDSSSVTGYMRKYLPDMIKRMQDIFSSRLDKMFIPIYNLMQAYGYENKKAFEKYSIRLNQSGDAVVCAGKTEVLQKALGAVSYYDGNGVQMAIEVAGTLACVVVALPMMLLDDVLGTDISDKFIDTVEGIADGFVNLLGNLPSKKKDAILSMKTSVNQMREEHKAEFLDQIEKQKEAIKNSLSETAEKFTMEYERIYGERKAQFDREKKVMEDKITASQQIHELFESYLLELKKERMM